MFTSKQLHNVHWLFNLGQALKYLIFNLARLGLLILLIVASGFGAARAQSVGIGTATPAASAALDVAAIGRGLLVPRLTAAQRTGIAAPAAGLLVYRPTARPAAARKRASSILPARPRPGRSSIRPAMTWVITRPPKP